MLKILLYPCIFLYVFVLTAAGQEIKPGTMNPPQRSTEKSLSASQAESLIIISRIYLEAGFHNEAKKLILDALAVAPQKSQIMKDAENLLSKAVEKTKEYKQLKAEMAISKQTALLDEANNLLDDAKFEAASKLIQNVISTAEDQQVLIRAKTLLVKTHPSWAYQQYKSLSKLINYSVYIVCFISFIILVYLLSLFARWLIRVCRGKDEWVLGNVVDNTEYGIRELITAAFHRLSTEKIPVTAGLLHAETRELPTSFILTLPEEPVHLVSVIESFPTIGGVSSGTIAKGFGSVWKWFKLQPPLIGGIAIVKDGVIYARLTRRTSDDKIENVSNFCKISEDIDAAAYVAEAVSFKMFYLISKDCSVLEADIADKLRSGLHMLGKYISGEKPEKLSEALKIFSQIRKESPVFDEAHLYEGITHDLLEQHDTAIQHFSFLREHAKEKRICEKATYNEAISHLRKYEPPSLDEAIRLLDNLIGEKPVLYSNPIKALSLAAKAVAIAHKPLFWYMIPDVLPRTEEDLINLEYKQSRANLIKEWISSVEDITNDLENITKKLKETENDYYKAWDDIATRQLEWAICNARGNIYLNCAINFLSPPQLPEPFGSERQMEYFKKAKSAFRKCEMLMPPGVETLSNLGTLFLFLGEFPQAREYLRRAITLNKNYEYAFYRLAQTWERENNVNEVVKILKSFKATPKISSFKKLFSKYSEDLRS